MSYTGEGTAAHRLGGDLTFSAVTSGTVTSIDVAVPSALLTASGGPITSSGTITLSLASKSANLIFASPDGTSGTGSFRSLVAGDIPSLDAAKITSGTFDAARIPALAYVTSVALSLPSIITVSGSPVTSSGTLTGTLATQTANTIFAGPTSGAAAAPTFRSVVAADLGSGTGNSKNYLRGDLSWAGPPYTLHVCTTTFHNPGDGLTYYVGPPGFTATTTADIRRVYIPRDGTIVAASVVSDTTTGTVGSNENISVYIRLNNTTSTLIATVGAATKYREFRNTSMSIAVVAGDYIEVEIVCPTWGTNPTSVGYNGHIVIA